MTERGLNFILDYHRNTDYWSNLEHNGWEFSGLSSKWGTNETKQLVSSAPDQKFGKNFQASHAVNLGQNDSYIIIGKGFP